MPLIRTVREVILPREVPYRVLLNIVDPRSTVDSVEARQLLDTQRISTFAAVVREYKAHKRAPLEGLVVTQYPADRYATKALDDYRRVALELYAQWSHTDRAIRLVEVL